MYYVRHRGVVSGPFDTAALRVMVRRSAISRIHQISTGEGTWVAAERFAELFGGPQKLGTGHSEGSSKVADADDLYPVGFMPPPVDGPLDLASAVEQSSFGYPRREPQMSSAMMVLAVFACAVVIATTAVIAYYLTRPQISSADQTPLPSKAVPGLVSAAGAMPAVPASVVPVVSAGASRVSPSPTDATPAMPLQPRAATVSSTPLVAHTVIAGIDEEAKIAKSVGLVVCGATVSRRGGPVSEVPSAEGSCFAVTADGYLLTNRHVIEEVQKLGDGRGAREGSSRRQGMEIRPKVWVFFAGAKYEAAISYVSPQADVAVLKINREQPFFRLSSGGKTPRNEDVFAIGFPGIAMQPLSEAEFNRQAEDESRRSSDVTEYFKPRDFEFTLTRGVLGRTYTAEGGITWIQHEATLRHGNSGGPLVNKLGIVLGINTRLQTSKQDVQTNLSVEIAQLKVELNQHVPGLVWE